ncbi:T9SS type A sorting domain-containing protein [bacterium]|nr:T9SS type A sorting domain-containing protein [bacterium]
MVNPTSNVQCGSNLINNSTATHNFGCGSYSFTGTTIGGTAATDLTGATLNFSGSSITIGDHSLGDGDVTFSNVNFTNTNSSVTIGANAFSGLVTFNGALNLSGDNATIDMQSGTVSTSSLTMSGANSMLTLSGGSLSVTNNIIAGNDVSLQAPAMIGGNMDVSGNLTIGNSCSVAGTVDVQGALNIGGTSAAGGFSGLVTVSGPVINITGGTNVFAGGLTHSSTAIGSSCVIGGSYSVGVAGTALTTLNSETIVFNGTTPDFYSLVISNVNGSFSSSADISVRNTISLAKDLNIPSNTLTFASTAPMVATLGSGEIIGTVQRTLQAVGSYTFNGTQTTMLVPTLASGTDYSFTLVKTAPDAQAVSRYYDIERLAGDMTPTGMVYTLGLQYKDSELNGNNENALLLAYGDLGTAGEDQFAKLVTSIVQTTSNTVTYHYDGVTSINHRYTLADLNAPLPVELTAFAARRKDAVVELRWTTATELNNHGFDIERAPGKDAPFEKIGFVNGAGTSNRELSYRFNDEMPLRGGACYRLRQIDRDGSISYSPVVEVSADTPEHVIRNYPNPFNPSTTITFTAAVSGRASLLVYNTLGKVVRELYDADVFEGETVSLPFEAGDLPGGAYFYTLTVGETVSTGKMLLTK